MTIRKRASRRPVRTDWDPVAHWYDGWMGSQGGKFHRELAIPLVLDLLDAQPGEQILDIGAGQGVLAPYIAATGARYTGLDASSKLVGLGKKHHGRYGTFLLGDGCNLADTPGLHSQSFDAAIFLFSIQNMDPLHAIFASVDWALKPCSRVVLLITHPCFRVPRQSGWGWDAERKLQYRRVDRYLTALPVPMKAYGNTQTGATRNFHRPLQDYINGLAQHGFLVEQMEEISGQQVHQARSKAETLAQQEIPLFLALRAGRFAA